MSTMTLRRDAGLSLVELMVALLLLAIALMGLAAAFAPGRMAIQAGDQATTATFLARRVLEDMRNRAYDQDSDELVMEPLSSDDRVRWHHGLSELPADDHHRQRRTGGRHEDGDRGGDLSQQLRSGATRDADDDLHPGDLEAGDAQARHR